MSRLLIHASVNGDGGRGMLGALVRRAWACVRHTPDSGVATLEIHDLQGHRMLTLTDASALVDIVLPTGTYHVTTQVGEKRRSYTAALQPGTTTVLYLQPHAAARIPHAASPAR
ncbi:T9SS type A sorting domain-containing protein [Hydrogenophaga sp. BPS33]|uniref:T9SS type A sorting domain-containing protein n=1 Tax=Hydrogenophaga sp. BPS33 TaxID=2651974 RepID=UPI0013203C5D|nr:T9SS type A sorting domain-containing protein [Hydrogenophaga sp. BPS33]QHE86159.1 T9SS type A sorting domain-containing protein [Hydrogenophaga sp. BPS33]